MSAEQNYRLPSVDILRGIVMVIMALDHTRDYFSGYPYDPLDLEHASAAMFFTRWITHFCAPVFIFLSGASAFLGSGRKTKRQLSLQLLSRGLWLIILELTVVRFGWQFNLDYSLVFVQVIWAIGWSMVFLSLLVFLPLPFIAFFSLVLIFGHNLLDGIHVSGSGRLFWSMLHEEAFITLSDAATIGVLYPLIPWVGVMAGGYAFGSLLMTNAGRDRKLYMLGIGSVLLFLLLRWANIYGDPDPWHAGYGWRSFLSFLDVNKYPPSLDFLLITLGPAIASLPLLDKFQGPVASFFTVYGRVPLFYYVCHIYLLHSLALLLAAALGFPVAPFFENTFRFNQNGWGFSLPAVYGFWLLAVAALYFPCRWFMSVKAAHRKWWLSYL